MSIRNPCDKELPGGDNSGGGDDSCAPGFTLEVGPDGVPRCTQELSEEPSPPPPPPVREVQVSDYGPFPANTIPDPTGQQLYTTATREITIIDNLNFIQSVNRFTIADAVSNFGFINSEFFLAPRLQFSEDSEARRRYAIGGRFDNISDRPDIRTQDKDRFRIALLNFWTAYGASSENLFVYHDLVDMASSGQSRASIQAIREQTPIILHPATGGRRKAKPTNPRNYFYSIETLENPVLADDGYYTTLEKVPFQFNRDVLQSSLDSINISDSGIADLRVGWQHRIWADIFVFGDEAEAWRLLGKDWWNNNPETRNYLSAGNISFGNINYDFVFDAPAAFYENELESMVSSPSHSAKITPHIRNVEIYDHLSANITELDIVNVYQYYQSKQLEKKIQNGAILQENLPPGLVEFSQRVLSDYESNSIRTDEDKTFSETLKFPSDRVEMLEEVNKSVRGALNNFVEIRFSTPQSGPLNASLQTNRMDLAYLQLLDAAHMKSITSPEIYSAVRDTQQELGVDADDVSSRRDLFQKNRYFSGVLDDTFFRQNARNITTTENDISITNSLQSIILNPLDIASGQSGPGSVEYKSLIWPRNLISYPLYYHNWDNTPLLSFEESIRSRIFSTQVDQIIRNNNLVRTYSALLKGRKAYSEVIGYKVEKYEIVNDTTEDVFGTNEKFIQEFIFMDNNNVTEVEFLDTQVLPNKKYKYKIFTINFVIGNRYRYSAEDTDISWATSVENVPALDPDTRGDNVIDMSVGVQSGIETALIPAPFFEKEVSTYDLPPMIPEVTFLPFQGVDDEYSVLLQSNNGEVMEKPIHVLSKDTETIRLLYSAQCIEEGEKLLYKSDSLPTHFEVMRIEEAPEKYTDFDDPNAVIFRRVATGKTCVINFQDIEPNKYYYYTFRTIDEGGMSNPTEVFKVRMVSYQNGIFMELEPYEMFVKPKEFKLSFGRNIKISPALNQKTINFSQVIERLSQESEESATSLNKIRKELGLKTPVDTKEFQKSAPAKEEISLGDAPEDKRVWDKRFKIRCTSKITGKKIDINVTFKQKKDTILRPS